MKIHDNGIELNDGDGCWVAWKSAQLAPIITRLAVAKGDRPFQQINIIGNCYPNEIWIVGRIDWPVVEEVDDDSGWRLRQSANAVAEPVER
jgi:hypothetical protein